MTETRLAVLQEKARTSGLSDAEANELGRLYAEAAGQPYSGPETGQEDRATVHELTRRARRHRSRGAAAA